MTMGVSSHVEFMHVVSSRILYGCDMISSTLHTNKTHQIAKLAMWSFHQIFRISYLDWSLVLDRQHAEHHEWTSAAIPTKGWRTCYGQSCHPSAANMQNEKWWWTLWNRWSEACSATVVPIKLVASCCIMFNHAKDIKRQSHLQRLCHWSKTAPGLCLHVPQRAGRVGSDSVDCGFTQEIWGTGWANEISLLPWGFWMILGHIQYILDQLLVCIVDPVPFQSCFCCLSPPFFKLSRS